MPDQQHVPEAPDESAAAPARQGIQSVELAMTVLQALEEGLGPMSLTQIASASAMGPSKAHRYLVSLARVGLVAQSPSTGLYDLGPAMRRLGIESLRRMDEVGLVTQHLPGLRDRTAHAVNLAVWGENGPVIVRWEYGAYALPITVRVGATMPLLTSAVGRAFFAYLPDTLTGPVLRAQLETDERGTPAQEEMARIRSDVLRDGVAVTSGGVIPGIVSLAAPVFTAGDSLPLVVALAMPARVVSEKDLAGLAEELRRSAQAMSEELGASWPPEKP
ncbi:IclR family transcriptional regulator [Actinomadura violacea]|uniref:IclR family transcriptional regulator n=1 Tax=Actinomadura violacea TaxID=2819934 RepID=A0ABS3S6W6_9ACTN|nr:IclR family transcriptional regulator [Actinomadura violacea]MBO2463945.1 IclR family transcriptional regulator [Actinomadura violacea]